MTMKPAIVIGLSLVLATAIIVLVPRLSPPTTSGTTELAELKSDLAAVKDELGKVKNALPPAPPRPEVEEASPLAVKLSVTELFTGEMKRLKPHLNAGLMSGCIKLKYGGSDLQRLRVVVQQWREGKAEDAFGPSWVKPDLSKGKEVTFSVYREPVEVEGKKYYGLVLASDGDAWWHGKQQPDGVGMTTPHQLRKEIEVKVPSEVIVWAWEWRKFKKDEGSFSIGSDPIQIEECLKKAQWAWAIKVIFSDKP